MKTLWAEKALTASGWQERVRVDINPDGRIAAVAPDAPDCPEKTGILLPAPVNLHSHSFQRAMAGMTEARGPDPQDSFWTWRKLMYRFLENLTPDDIESISALVQMEMLEAGYASVGEFHYLHHQANGKPYDDIAELSQRVASAANETGIGLTLLPVLYEHGGCDGRPLGRGQTRFGNKTDRYLALFDQAECCLRHLPKDTRIGVAPHSLRAVSKNGLRTAIELAGDRPLHIHVAEQVKEVEEVEAAWGARPVNWLLAEHDVGESWCLIHATQMLPEETSALAKTGAVVGLCPITESSLGDGIFDGVRYVAEGGRWGIGSDSNIRISLSEELRTLEYSQRLRDRGRAMLANSTQSTGRVLFAGAVAGGAQATGRETGSISVGQYADLVALDSGSENFIAVSEDQILDTLMFAGDDQLVTDVWSAGRHVVTHGQHVRHDAIVQRYKKTMRQLASRL